MKAPPSEFNVSVEQVTSSVSSADWEYSDADTQELTHNIHRYSGKFIPQVAARVISTITGPGDTVLDPFMGSGTTLLEAGRMNRRAIGIDLNPVAVLIAKAKLTPIPREDLSQLVTTMKQLLASDPRLSTQLPLYGGSDIWARVDADSRLESTWHTKWFSPRALRELIAIDHAISTVEDRSLADLCRIALSNILRKTSNAHSGYPNVMFDKNAREKPSPLQAYMRSLKDVASMVTGLWPISHQLARLDARLGDASSIPFTDQSVDAVVTHPPYIGSIPYAEYGQLSLEWFGWSYKELDKRLTGGRRQTTDVVKRFEEAYLQMMRESLRVLREGRYAFFMVGNPVVRGEVVDLAAMTKELALDIGFEFVVEARRNGINRRANKMGAEHLLFFRRPYIYQACARKPSPKAIPSAI